MPNIKDSGFRQLFIQPKSGLEHVGGGGVQPHRDGDGVLHGLPHGVLEEMLRQKKGSERSKPGHGDR